MTQTDDFRALQMVAHAQRFTSPFTYPLTWARGRLIQRTDEFLKRKGIKDREMRLKLVAGVVERPINSFSELFEGEVRAMLDEPKLEEIFEWLLTPVEKK